MNRFNKVTNMVRSRPTGLEDWLFGCAHHRMTFPMTLRAGVGGGPRAQSETYIACLDCGRHFAYDWRTMRAAKRRIAWIDRPLQALIEAIRASWRQAYRRNPR
jgi:hypothetical protein